MIDYLNLQSSIEKNELINNILNNFPNTTFKPYPNLSLALYIILLPALIIITMFLIYISITIYALILNHLCDKNKTQSKELIETIIEKDLKSKDFKYTVLSVFLSLIVVFTCLYIRQHTINKIEHDIAIFKNDFKFDKTNNVSTYNKLVIDKENRDYNITTQAKTTFNYDLNTSVDTLNLLNQADLEQLLKEYGVMNPNNLKENIDYLTKLYKEKNLRYHNLYNKDLDLSEKEFINMYLNEFYLKTTDYQTDMIDFENNKNEILSNLKE